MAILAGVVTTGLVGMSYGLLEPLSWTHPMSVWMWGLYVGLLIALPGVVVAVLIARRRVYRRGCCRRCGYDLTGNTSGRYPECGTSHKEFRPHGPHSQEPA